MADPRKRVTYDDIEPQYMTFAIDDSTVTFDKTKVGGSSQVGLAVNLSTHGTVQLADDAQAVLGVLIQVDGDKYATVQTGGICSFKGGASATLTVGTPIYGDQGAASAKGYIQTCPTSTAAAPLGRGMIIDSSTTTDVKVLMP